MSSTNQTDKRKELGKSGEQLAREYLRKKGYKILEHNYRTRYGEIDIIAQQDSSIVFIEVRTKRTPKFGPPQLSITKFKRNQITKSALAYIKENAISDQSCRFDVVAITFESSGTKIDHIENAFELDRQYMY